MTKFLYSLLGILFFLTPTHSFAAIAFDAATVPTSSTTIITFSHTTSGSNRILFVSATSNGGGSVTGVTYNGVSMAEIAHHTDVNGPTQYLFHLVGPALGTNNVVINLTTGVLGVGSAVSYTGA